MRARYSSQGKHKIQDAIHPQRTPKRTRRKIPTSKEASSNHAREKCPSLPESINIGDLKSKTNQDKFGNLTTAPGIWGEVDAKSGEVKEPIERPDAGGNKPTCLEVPESLPIANINYEGVHYASDSGYGSEYVRLGRTNVSIARPDAGRAALTPRGP